MQTTGAALGAAASLGLAGGVLLGRSRLLNAVSRDVRFCIGMYGGPDPLHLRPLAGVRTPAITAEDVTDVAADFVADPFMIHVGDCWYMFFETFDGVAGKGVIGLATSRDTGEWTYERVVLWERHHLSYPYVFAWQGAYYLVPESQPAHEVALYRALAFPYRWERVARLLVGDYLDASLVRHDHRWWLFASLGNDSLHLFFAEDLRGPWSPHPLNPVVAADPTRARPGGRVVPWDGSLVRFGQDDGLYYGRQLRAFVVETLTPDGYAEREAGASPVLGGSGQGWNALGMHHADPHQVQDGRWIACVDGSARMLVWGRRGGRRRTWRQLARDLRGSRTVA